MLAKDKHSSLFRKTVNYGRKKFYSTGPRLKHKCQNIVGLVWSTEAVKGTTTFILTTLSKMPSWLYVADYLLLRCVSLCAMALSMMTLSLTTLTITIK
jgi:hypothetical protein